MKIAYYSFNPLPSRSAASIHVMKMCQAFGSVGHETTLFVPAAADPMPDHEIFRYYGVEQNFRIMSLPKPRFGGGGITYGILCAIKAKSMGVDLAYCRHLFGGFFSVKFGIPTILESHAPFEENGAIYSKIFGYLLGCSDLKRVAVITDSLRRHYEQRYPGTHGKMFVIPDGADVPGDEIVAPEIKGDLNTFRVGYTGSLYEGKGIEVILLLAAKCDWATFHIIGGTDEAINGIKASQAVPANIHFYGFQEPRKIIGYLKTFDAVLLPNQEVVKGGGSMNIADWTSPMKLFEYMASERPIVASNLPVLGEILQHGKNALLCQCRDIECWAAALKRLSTAPQFGARLARNAFHDLSTKYTWEKRAQRITNEYQAACPMRP